MHSGMTRRFVAPRVQVCVWLCLLSSSRACFHRPVLLHVGVCLYCCMFPPHLLPLGTAYAAVLPCPVHALHVLFMPCMSTAAMIAAELASRGIKLEVVVDEGSSIVMDGILPLYNSPVALVATAEKAYVQVEVSACRLAKPGPCTSALGQAPTARSPSISYPFFCPTTCAACIAAVGPAASSTVQQAVKWSQIGGLHTQGCGCLCLCLSLVPGRAGHTFLDRGSLQHASH